MHFTPLENIIEQSRGISRIYNLKGSSSALLFALLDDPFCIVELTDEHSYTLSRDINFYRRSLDKKNTYYLPIAGDPAASGERCRIAQELGERDSLVCSFHDLVSPIWSQQEARQSVIHLQRGHTLSRDELEREIQHLGYKEVPLVTAQGEYRRREWLFDIYPSLAEVPVRIEFFGDEIETIKHFDIDTQSSIKESQHISIHPSDEPVSTSTVVDFMSGRACFFSDSIQEKDRLPGDGVFFSRYPIRGTGLDAGSLSMRGLGILPEERKDINELSAKLHSLEKSRMIRIICSSSSQADRVTQIVREGGVIAPVISDAEIFSYPGRTAITIGELSAGLYFPGILILTEKELFGGSPGYRPLKKSHISKLLTSLDDLSPGDFIVHREHGIGKFRGITRQSIENIEEDLMILDYEGGRLYLPLQSIKSIHKYHSEEGINPKIDKLGGKTWQRTKARVKKRIQDMAQKIITLSAQRKIQRGFCFSPDTELHKEFDSFFRYEETPDQMHAITDIKQDMESERPMDRLICGDVGYGKTEVAMRAAFKAVYDGMQVAVLVPTTILCEQHFRTFRARFSAFPISIDYLSRFKSRDEQKKILRALANGDIDIIIGTHGLLSRSISFFKLGILVIDEEHRFGVGQKEHLKELTKGVDVITMTATPIPRTLSMALSHIRDMSIIETPPEERLAVKTIVSILDEQIIHDAIQAERERDGQIFFVHNRIQDIHKVAVFLKKNVPAIRMAVAHGQMPEKDLSKAMLDFYDRRVDLLLSTAIIGSGLDIPTANTIIINRADKMGLADLYQLRGRVGRGTVKAYAYFLTPPEDVITEEAKKRLQAIQEMSYLGAGFRLAIKDLEIRGAGNLLGAEQSGHIKAVGFDLYIEMLEKIVAEIKGLPVEEELDPTIRLSVHAFIPEEYVENVTLRLSLYRKIASAKTLDDIQSITHEIQDRFGALPREVMNLLSVMKLKTRARTLRITSIRHITGMIHVHFSPDTMITPDDIFALYDLHGKKIRFLPDGFELNTKGISFEKVYREISALLENLEKSPSLLA